MEATGNDDSNTPIDIGINTDINRLPTDIHPDSDSGRLTFNTNRELTIGRVNSENLQKALGNNQLEPVIVSSLADATAGYVTQHQVDQSKWASSAVQRIISISMRGNSVPEGIKQYTQELDGLLKGGNPLKAEKKSIVW